MREQTPMNLEKQIGASGARAAAALEPATRGHAMRDSACGTSAVELSDDALDVASGGLVVNAIIAVLIQPLLPSGQNDMSPDQARQVAAGNPIPRPR